MLVKLKDIHANPFRHIDRYPIRRDKVEALRASFRRTGFWDNVVARKGADGRAEIAYGHHRLVALREEMRPNDEVELIVKRLDDAAMLQIMANENMEEWGTSALVEQETVRAVVEAYAQGLIELPAVNPNTSANQIRYAPSFVPGGDPALARAPGAYTAATVATFIGWISPNGEPQRKVANAITALQYIEEGLVTDKQFEGLTTKGAEALVEETRKARTSIENRAKAEERQAADAAKRAEVQARAEAQAVKERERAEKEARRAAADAKAATVAQERKAAERRQREAEERAEAAKEAARAAAKEQRGEERLQAKALERAAAARAKSRGVQRAIAHQISADLKSGKIGTRGAEAVAREIQSGPRNKRPVDFDRFLSALRRDIGLILDPQRDERMKRVETALRFIEHAEAHDRENLAKSFRGLIERAAAILKQVEVKPGKRQSARETKAITDERHTNGRH